MNNDIIKDNQNLIYSIIIKYKNHFDLDDLFQVGSIALLNAYKNYNSRSNTKFSSYAYFYIIGEVNKYIRESNFFKIGKKNLLLNRKINIAREKLTQINEKVPTNKQLADFLEIDESIIEEVEQSSIFVESLDYEQECSNNLYDTIGYNEKSYSPEVIDLKSEIAKLDSFSRELIKERYLYGNSQTEASNNLGISQVTVSRKEKEILLRLRTRLK